MRVQPISAARPLPRELYRLALFTVASVVVHAVAVGYGPAGLPHAPQSGLAAERMLHATLAPAESPSLAQKSDAQDTPLQESGSQPAADAPAAARAGTPDGINLPLPDKWFTASELDKRAEPLTSPSLEYPEELVGMRPSGRVQVLLFIDERGIVRKTEVTAAIPEHVFDKAAIKAWSEVRFSPALKGGAAVKSQKLLEMEFLPF